MEEVKIGFLGFGNVGTGAYKLFVITVMIFF